MKYSISDRSHFVTMRSIISAKRNLIIGKRKKISLRLHILDKNKASSIISSNRHSTYSCSSAFDFARFICGSKSASCSFSGCDEDSSTAEAGCVAGKIHGTPAGCKSISSNVPFSPASHFSQVSLAGSRS